jgi:hypothetical protein
LSGDQKQASEVHAATRDFVRNLLPNSEQVILGSRPPWSLAGKQLERECRPAGNAFNGIAKRTELWIDGTKVGEDLEDQLEITATLAKSSHTVSFVGVDIFDNTASKPITFTVN